MDAYQWKSLDQYERTEALENRAHTIDNRVESRVGGLCGRCSHAIIYRRRGYPHYTIVCTALDREVPDDISECSRYSDPRARSLGQMVEMALDLDPRPRVGQYL